MDITELDERIQTIFHNLSSFNYDKVKELCDSEKDRSKTNQCHPSWNTYINLLLQLNIAEKQYSSLSFLLPTKGFLRKENSLKVIYEALFIDVSKCLESLSPPKSSLEEWLNPIVMRTVKFVSARSSLVELYGKLVIHSNEEEPLMPFESYVLELRSILEKNDGNNNRKKKASFVTLETGLECELGALLNLLEALVYSSKWDLFNSLMKIDVADDKLRIWSEAYKTNKEERKISFTSAFLLRPQQDPLLYQWFWKLKGAVLSKFSLYFHDILIKQTSPVELKNQCSKLTIDYTSRVLTGLELYPSAFSTPGSPPLNHWPNIIMILEDFSDNLANFEEIVHFHDVQYTYFISRIEERMILVAIYGVKKNDKNIIVSNFFYRVECSAQV
ncbi:C12ORF66 [Lepeophtheirus salmonis]|uniref:C12ORF66 n=1 Tax=Lepeophtheirus salmonis TaxID=72036 RepID=A0A7R8D5D5_LEPSM|nr:C12ORF66 [Lepeophtheirus salmonis]CAF3034834.1 C12ORF66 [Lepeophtheirus salmonis]